MPLRIAISGTGWAAQTHAAAVQRLSDARVVAVVNHRRESAEELARKYHFQRIYTSVPDLLAGGEVDALVIATPNALHAPQALAALRGGLHVLVEKPMALNTQEAEEMTAAAGQAGRLLMVAQCWRFDPEVLWLRDQIKAGRIGQVVRSRCLAVHVKWGPAGWFTQPELAGGGATLDMGVHALDTTRFLLGDPTPHSVFARLGAYYTPGPLEDTADALVTWADGSHSAVEAGWWQPHADGPAAAAAVYGTAGFGSTFPTRLEIDGKEIASGFPHPRPDSAQQLKYERQMEAFVSAAQGGADEVPTGETGLQTQRILDAIYESSRTEKLVLL